jgi:hypothetical protein
MAIILSIMSRKPFVAKVLMNGQNIAIPLQFPYNLIKGKIEIIINPLVWSGRDKMKNKLNGCFVLILVSLLAFNSSCKKSEEAGIFVITSGQGYVYYDGIVFQTNLSFSCGISNQSGIAGTINSWKFVFKNGSTELLEITSENCSSYNIIKFENVPIKPYSVREISGEAIPAIERDLFPYGDPDNMDISVTITDDNSHKATIHFNAPVSYNEYND